MFPSSEMGSSFQPPARNLGELFPETTSTASSHFRLPVLRIIPGISIIDLLRGRGYLLRGNGRQ
jgi:hypothetical protein